LLASSPFSLGAFLMLVWKAYLIGLRTPAAIWALVRRGVFGVGYGSLGLGVASSCSICSVSLPSLRTSSMISMEMSSLPLTLFSCWLGELALSDGGPACARSLRAQSSSVSSPGTTTWS
jgi:hypothetical protein